VERLTASYGATPWPDGVGAARPRGEPKGSSASVPAQCPNEAGGLGVTGRNPVTGRNRGRSERGCRGTVAATGWRVLVALERVAGRPGWFWRCHRSARTGLGISSQRSRSAALGSACRRHQPLTLERSNGHIVDASTREMSARRHAAGSGPRSRIYATSKDDRQIVEASHSPTSQPRGVQSSPSCSRFSNGCLIV
jgi:hypothetical protein